MMNRGRQYDGFQILFYFDADGSSASKQKYNMQYNHDWLKAEMEAGKRVKFIFFWGHQPRKDGQISSTCFSQWFDRAFEQNGIVYRTAEHWMMAEKARLFKDMEVLEKILHCKTPKEAKSWGRKVKHFKEDVWVANRMRIVCNGNYLKFSQHEDLRTYLEQTGDRVLVEASPYDTIWGIGMKSDHKNATNPEKWRGLNLLGYALMEVRVLLRNQ